MTMATAYHDEIRVAAVARRHEVDEDRASAMMAHLRETGYWDLPPVLVVEDQGNGVLVLDGHHRLAVAARWAEDPERTWDLDAIPALVVPADAPEGGSPRSGRS